MAKKEDFDARRRNVSGHGFATSQLRNKLRERGVSQSELDKLPLWDATGSTGDMLRARDRAKGSKTLPSTAREGDFAELRQYDTDPTVKGIDKDAVRRARILRGDLQKKPKKMAKGGSTASKRADGCATKGKTKGRFV